MASYLIFAVHYEQSGRYRHIASVRVCQDYGTSLGEAFVSQRQEVVSAINRRLSTYRTLYEENGDWHRGAVVQVVNVNGIDYLRTDSNRVAEDNLGNLPEF